MSESVSTSRDGRVLTATISNPPHNFMTRDMVAELGRVVDSLEGDGSIGAVVITGDGGFVTHYDIAEILAGSEGFGPSVGPGLAGVSLRGTAGLARVPGVGGALRRTPAVGVLELHDVHDLFLRMERLDKVFLAAIGGPALGGGCELALACDIRYMAADAGAIGLPETTLGIMPGAGGSQRLSRALGPSRAIELILEGRPLDPAEALDLGLVHRVVAADSLLAEATAAAERLARRAPMSVAGAKRAVYDGGAGTIARGLATERKWFLATASSDEARRGMRAYVDELAASGAPPWASDEALTEWREGTAVDLVESE